MTGKKWQKHGKPVGKRPQDDYRRNGGNTGCPHRKKVSVLKKKIGQKCSIYVKEEEAQSVMY